MERYAVATGVELRGWQVSRVESALLRLFPVPSVESEIVGDVAGYMAKWDEGLEGQRSRIARRLALIDAQLGLSESHPVLSVVGTG